MSTLPASLTGLEDSIDALRDVGALFYERGWSVGTSSNYSLVLQRDPLELLVTASGKDKRRLQREDFVRVDEEGRPLLAGQGRASAETMLHVVVAHCLPQVGAVLHTHSVWATVLSDLYFSAGGVKIAGFEMLKGLAGITTHESEVWLEIMENTQDIPDLAARVGPRLTDTENPLKYGYLIHRHGLYTWGCDLEEARRHVEVLEFLLECTARRLSLRTP